MRTLAGVLQALSFLKDVNLGKKPAVGKNVVVVGGGSVAMDVASSALRLGAGSVQVVCLECSHDEMPAQNEEIEQAIEEGIKVDMSWGPKAILTTGGKAGKVKGVELKRCVTCYNKAGQFAPVYDEKKTKTIEADMVITAIGQRVDLSFMKESKVKATKRGTIETEDRSLATNVKGVFAGGDVARGQGTMIEAMADGKKAAVAIDCYLRGVDLPPAPPAPILADVTDSAFVRHLREYTKEPRMQSRSYCRPPAGRATSKRLTSASKISRPALMKPGAASPAAVPPSCTKQSEPFDYAQGKQDNRGGMRDNAVSPSPRFFKEVNYGLARGI